VVLEGNSRSVTGKREYRSRPLGASLRPGAERHGGPTTAFFPSVLPEDHVHDEVVIAVRKTA
jgi:hypothetical protein